jgi:single-stranded DNA-binding protein
MDLEDDYPVPNMNTVTLAGKVPKAPGLVYRQDGVAVLRFVVVIEDYNAKLNKMFSTAVPCELVGDRAEPLSAELAAGDTVPVRGRLSYRSSREQTGGGLGVYGQVVQRLTPRAAVSAVS